MKLKKGDIIIVFILFLALFFWLIHGYIWPDADKKIAVIEIDGQFFREINLDPNSLSEEIELDLGDGKHLHITALKGGIQVEEATCPNQVCVETGFISKAGQSIVCLPYKVVVYIRGYADENNIDDVSY